VLLVCAVARAAERVDEPRVAVVVGNNLGVGGEAPLEYAEEDARRVHQLLVEAGGVAPEQALLVTGGTAETVRQALAEARGRLSRLGPHGPRTLVLYVSSHADEESLHLGGTRLPLGELKQWLAATPATLRVALVDACQTPVRARDKGGVPIARDVPVQVEVPSRVEGTVLLMAAARGESAQEWSSLKGSLFTHHVLAALHGLADADGDGAISLAELYTYAWRQTLASSTLGGAGVQHPSVDLRLSGWGDWVMARPERLGALLVLGEDVEGPLWVTEHPRGWVTEIRKALGSATRLALRPGRYRVVAPQGRFAEATDVLLGTRAERRLTRADFLRVPLERVRPRGGEAQALRPWGLSVGYGLSTGSVRGMAPEHFGELGLWHQHAGYSARARLGFTRARMERELFALSQTELRLSLGGGWRLPVGPLELTLGAEAQGTWVRQSIARVDAEQAERLYGLAEPPRWGLLWGLGPFAALACPVSERLQLSVEGAVGLTHTPRMEGSADLRPSAWLHAAVQWAL
jgi:hypothetical protein